MTPKKQLDEFIGRFTPEVASLARKALARMRKLAPGALIKSISARQRPRRPKGR